MSMFKKATKTSAKLRLALIGPPGSGKTWTGLTVASALGKRIAVIDTERGSASKYADAFNFDTLELEEFHPQSYAKAIAAAAAEGYDVLLIDSLSHAWIGKGGALELHDNAVAKSKSGNTWAAWREVTPHHNDLVEAIVQAKCHVIATMRSKVEYVQEKDERGKNTVRKVGLAPVQRDGLEYEFDVVGDIDAEHTLIVTKSRCPLLADKIIRRPDAALAETLRVWLGTGPAAAAPARSVVNGTPLATPSAPAPTGPTEAQQKQIQGLWHELRRLVPTANYKGYLERVQAREPSKMDAEQVRSFIAAIQNDLAAAQRRAQAEGESINTIPTGEPAQPKKLTQGQKTRIEGLAATLDLDTADLCDVIRRRYGQRSEQLLMPQDLHDTEAADLITHLEEEEGRALAAAGS